MADQRIPLPTVGFTKQIAQAMSDIDAPIQTINYAASGEFTSGETNRPLGVVAYTGKITDFILAVDGQGRDDNDDLAISGELKLNGVSILESPVIIEGVSGETPASIVGARPSFSSSAVSRGDLLSVDLDLIRTTPDTEINNVYLAVKIVPVP